VGGGVGDVGGGFFRLRFRRWRTPEDWCRAGEKRMGNQDVEDKRESEARDLLPPRFVTVLETTKKRSTRLYSGAGRGRFPCSGSRGPREKETYIADCSKVLGGRVMG